MEMVSQMLKNQRMMMNQWICESYRFTEPFQVISLSFDRPLNVSMYLPVRYCDFYFAVKILVSKYAQLAETF